MTDDTLLKECESLLDGLDATYHDIAFGGTLDDVMVKYKSDVAMLLAFARAQQAAGMQIAADLCELEAIVDDERGYYGKAMGKMIREHIGKLA